MYINSAVTSCLISFISPFLFDSFKLASASGDFSVYCSSNMDGTGLCTREDTSAPLNCIVLQGAIINCKDESGFFECLQYGPIIAHQSQFSCKLSIEKSEDSSVSDTGVQSDLEQSPLTEDSSSSLNPFESSQTQPNPDSKALEDIF